MRKLMWFVLGFAAACALMVYTMAGVSLLVCIMGVMAAAVCFFLPKRLFRRPAAVLLGFALGAIWCTGYTYLTTPKLPAGNDPVPFTAVAAVPGEKTAYGQRVEAEVSLPAGKYTAMLYYSNEEQILPGDIVTGTACFRPTATSAGESDDLYHRADGVTLTGSVSGKLTVTAPETLSLRAAMALFALRLQENIHRIFPSSSAGYFTALVTGDRSGLTYDFRNRMSACGLFHAVSLSGMHVSVLMGMILLLCGKRKKLAACLGIPVLVLFVLLSGVRPATVRAAIMYSVLLLGAFAEREYDSVTSLCAALLPLLVHNPWCIAQWGLQLSFLSTAGILVLYPVIFRNVRSLPVRNVYLKAAVETVMGTAGVSLSATAFSLPLMAAYFGMVSLIAPLTNLLALWSVMASFVGGIVTALLAFLPLPLASWLGSVLHWLYVYLELILSIFSDLPLAFVDQSQPLLFAWSFLFYGLLLAWLLFRTDWLVPAVCAVVTFAAALGLTALQTDPDGFTLLDVGQGQSIVCARGDTAYLIDCGGRQDDSGELAARFLRNHRRDRLNAVILTHFDGDHCNGVLQLLRRIRVDALYYPVSEDSENKRMILAAAAEHGIPAYMVTSPVALPFPGGSVTLYPALEKTDNSGVCVLASGEECDILITGDLSQKEEMRLLTTYDLPDLEVLVAGHHGSAYATGRVLLEQLLPETVLISVGENSYGHPASETLLRLHWLGAKIYTTKENGNLTIGW